MVKLSVINLTCVVFGNGFASGGCFGRHQRGGGLASGLFLARLASCFAHFQVPPPHHVGLL